MPVDATAFKNSAELLNWLAGRTISVPRRTNARLTCHTECWVICRLLSTLAKESRLNFPVSVIHRDRPDVLLEFEGKKVGVEITEAVTKSYASYLALAEREFPGAFLEPAHFRHEAKELNVNEIRKLLQQGELTSDGWSGDHPEHEWAKFMLSVIDTKLAKLTHANFETFNENWLAIYDNLPLPNIDLGKSLIFLQTLLQKHWFGSRSFDTVYVESGAVVAKISKMGSEQLVLNNLWTEQANHLRDD